jgi:two-component system, sensor histidine kinase and response regulator
MTLIDRDLALDRLGGDEELWIEISKLFIQECPRMLQQLQEAVQQGDAHSLMETAHSMKGSLATLGAEDGALMALDLEMMGRNGVLGASGEALARLEKMLNALRSELPITV